MKMKDVDAKIKEVNSLKKQHDRLKLLLKSMVDFKKKYPVEFNFDEAYYERIVVKIEQVEKELTNMFK